MCVCVCVSIPIHHNEENSLFFNIISFTIIVFFSVVVINHIH